MSNPHANEISLDTSKSENNWDEAIADVEAMIVEAKQRVSRLKRSVKTFKELRDKGEPFPGQVKEPSEAKSNAAQK